MKQVTIYNLLLTLLSATITFDSIAYRHNVTIHSVLLRGTECTFIRNCCSIVRCACNCYHTHRHVSFVLLYTHISTSTSLTME
uniref:Putative secreted protein n=1 Tax=Anopheles darlingi TaxID=43151 RepID=A0A2M4DJC0_ANODA